MFSQSWYSNKFCGFTKALYYATVYGQNFVPLGMFCTANDGRRYQASKEINELIIHVYIYICLNM